MKLSSNNPSPLFWRYADELDKRDLDLSYPEKIVKAIKSAFFNNMNFEGDHLVFKITQKNGAGIDDSYLIPATPNTRKALYALYMKDYHKDIIGHKHCPTSQDLVDLLSESDKYFSMCVAIKTELPIILNQINLGEYKYAATSIALLTERFNEEIIKLINQFFIKKSHYNPATKEHHTYRVFVNRTYIISNEAYVSVRLIRIASKRKLKSLEDTEDILSVADIYSNYDILCMPDIKYKIENTGSFLLDCKKITQLKKGIKFTSDEIIDFHDLIRYGNYSDYILSPDVINGVTNIIKTENWIHTFFFTLTLYCNQLIDIETDTSQVVSASKEMVDPSKLTGIGMFIESIKFLDDIYDKLVLK